MLPGMLAGDPALVHSVAHHCLDVAACALLLTSHFRSPVRVSPKTTAALIALHDIGKFTRPFQAKAGEPLWPQALGAFRQPPSGPAHDQAGFALLSDEIEFLFSDWPGRSERIPLLRAIAGHHGRPPAMRGADELDRRVACSVCVAAAGKFAQAVRDVIDPPSLPSLSEREIARLAWWLAGRPCHLG